VTRNSPRKKCQDREIKTDIREQGTQAQLVFAEGKLPFPGDAGRIEQICKRETAFQHGF
jgi:hypothetical protein